MSGARGGFTILVQSVLLLACLPGMGLPGLTAQAAEPAKGSQGGESSLATPQAAKALAATVAAAKAVDLKDIEALAREMPGFAVQMYRLAGQTCLSRGQPARAVAMYRRALQVDPTDLGAAEDLAEAQLKAALAHQAFPQHTVQVYRHLGQLYEQTGRLDAAHQLYEQALEFVRGVPNEAASLTAEFKTKAEQKPNEVAP